MGRGIVFFPTCPTIMHKAGTVASLETHIEAVLRKGFLM